MINFLIKFIQEFKEYLVVIFLSFLSLSLLSMNEKPQIKRVRVLALGEFALLSSQSSGLFSPFGHEADLRYLREVNARLMLEINRLREYGYENSALKNLTGFKDTSKLPLLPARVVSKLVLKSRGNLIVDAGSASGVAKGMPVINDRGLVGIVSEVASNYSLVRTIQNSDLKLAVKDQRTGVEAVLSWSGSKLIMKNIADNYSISNGDRVVTSDLSTIMIPSIPVGLISNKDANVSGVLGTVVVTPFVDFNSVKYLFILREVQNKQIDNLEMNLFVK